MLLRGGGNHAPCLIDEECACAACPNIYAENNHDFLSLKVPVFCLWERQRNRRIGGKIHATGTVFQSYKHQYGIIGKKPYVYVNGVL
jgi:hypothetical protein